MPVATSSAWSSSSRSRSGSIRSRRNSSPTYLDVPMRHPRRPASDLSWLRAVHFCNAASEWEGLDRVYLFDGEDVSWDTTADGYRLPTEGGVGVRVPRRLYGSALRAPRRRRVDECGRRVHSAGHRRQAPEPERSLRHARQCLGMVLGPAGPARYDDYRVFRGGGFADDAWSVRASVRRGGAPRIASRGRGSPARAGSLRHSGGGPGVVGPRETGERAVQDGPLPSGWTPRRQ